MYFLKGTIQFEPWHGISHNEACATSIASDQPAHTRSLIRAFASFLNMSVKLLTEHFLVFLSLQGGCIGSSESTLVKMPYCLKSHVEAHLKMSSAVIFNGAHHHHNIIRFLINVQVHHPHQWAPVQVAG